MSAVPRGTDRRRTIQREEDRNLHYAEQNLIAAALAWEDPDPASLLIDVADNLEAACAAYKRAASAAHPTFSVLTTPPCVAPTPVEGPAPLSGGASVTSVAGATSPS